MDGSRTPYPRPHWRHFAVNIISPAILTFALFFGLIFAVIIPTMKKNIIERKKEMIRELTQAAWSELAGLHEQEKQGALTRAAAQQAAIARIQNMRYGDDGKDYFWISDTQTRMVMHPYRPELNGQSLSDYSDPAGKKLFVEFTQVVRERGRRLRGLSVAVEGRREARGAQAVLRERLRALGLDRGDRHLPRRRAGGDQRR